jgi:V-type H+-transporting ATPase subunit a
MIFRSEDMSYFDLQLTLESGWYFIEEIGRLRLIQIIPSETDSFKKSIYTEQVEQCKTILHRLDKIESVSQKLAIPISSCPDVLEFVERLNNTLTEREKIEQRPRHTLLNEISDVVASREAVINEISRNYDGLQSSGKMLCERYNVLKTLQSILPRDVLYKNIENADIENKITGFGFYYLCGTIATKDAFRLQRALFRVSRENALLQLLDVETSNEKFNNKNEDDHRKVFFIVFQSGPGQLLRQKVLDLLKSFDAHQQILPETYDKIDQTLVQLEADFDQVVVIQDQTKERLAESLKFFTEADSFSKVSPIEELRMTISKELSIFAELSKFTIENKIMSARFWIAKETVPVLMAEIARIKKENEQVQADVFEIGLERSASKPPTHFKLTDLTAPYQLIVDTYGVPRYKEANPGLFTIATFPYLFGVMFGDIGHGGILLLVGFLLIYLYEPLKSKGLGTLLEYRYLLFSMGVFSFYCGLVYNDFLGIPWKLFGSCYVRTHKRFERIDDECTYPLGFDSTWFMAKEEVGFMNSFKMKLSIIVGVTHMMGGIFLKAMNSVFFKNYIDLIFEFIPQFVFMAVTFGYMCVTIVLKWMQDWGDGSNAPSIISIFINLGTTSPDSVLWGDDQGIQQTNFQHSLFKIAFLCFWLMLIPKPAIIAIRQYLKRRNEANQNYQTIGKQGDEPLIGDHEKHNKDGAHHEEEHDISEIFVHQMIEVIEFVLGSISNTASYLRLWALSLAHGQLAKVFLDMTVLNQIKAGSPISAVIGFPIFLGCTVFVLMLMDLMECFLHTLRLHWVEFQNKFYKGDGYKFEPFDIAASIQEKMANSKGVLSGSETS